MKRTRDDKEDDLFVFGYSSKLFPRDDLEGRDENSYLINWADDDNILIDRYDCRVFLQDLSENTIGSSTNTDNDEFTDKIEEELCEVERYKDLNEALVREKEPVEKRGRGTEIGFSYNNDSGATNENDDDLSDESEGEDGEEYEPPAGVKMPVGINLPETARRGHVIERTARFVASHGNQVEIIIKAKHRNHKGRFDFLEFDHPLNSFYKYMCKLIREKKYVPPPIKPKVLPGEHIVQPRPVKSEESDGSDSDSDGGDYLHPLLSAKPRQSANSPIPLPVTSNKSNPYSSLYENFYENKKKEEPTTSKETVAEPTPKVPEPPSNFETDPLEIHNYNIWHQSFYGRPSVFLPNPPPRLKIPPNEIISQINVAARFVAGNGSFSERTLLEHNSGRLNFLFPNSEYLIYYHNKVRFFQSRLTPRVAQFVHSKYHEGMEAVKDLPPRPPSQPLAKIQQDPTSFANFSDVISKIPPAPQPPEPIKTRDFPDNDSKSEENDEEIKRKRKERAQQFMADIIRKKKADADEKSEIKKQELAVPADIVVPNLISSLVSGQLEKITLKKDTDSTKDDEKESDRKKKRSRSRHRSRSRERSRRSSRERSHRRRRSRSPSYERRRRRSPSYEERSPDRRRRRRSRS